MRVKISEVDELGSEARFHGGRGSGGGRSKEGKEVSGRTVIFGLVVDIGGSGGGGLVCVCGCKVPGWLLKY